MRGLKVIEESKKIDTRLNFTKSFLLTFCLLLTAFTGVAFSAVEFISLRSIDRYYDNYQFGSISSFFVYEDEIFVADRMSKKVYIFDFEGTPLFNFGSDRNLGGSPNDLVVLNDNIYISFDKKNSIEVFNILGNKVREIEAPYKGFKPRILAVAEDKLMVVDIGTKRVCFFDQKGQLVSSFSTKQSFASISGAFYKNGKIYLLSPTRAPVVRILDEKGVFLSGFGTIGESSTQFSTPSSITVGEDGILWISDSFRGLAVGVEEDGSPVSVLSGKWTKNGRFNFPSKIYFSKDTAFVLETGDNKISVLKKENRP